MGLYHIYSHVLQASPRLLGCLQPMTHNPALPPRTMQDPRVERLPCTHSGTYADDCICERVRQHRCYIVATCDRDLRRRIRKVGCPTAPMRAF